MSMGLCRTAFAEDTGREEKQAYQAYEVIEDEITSLTDEKTYDIELDYSTMDEAAVCLVRMGESYLTMKIIDDSGNVIATVGAADVQPKRWVYIKNPRNDSAVAHYTITMSGQNYIQDSGQFRVIYGNKKYVESMISGAENATPIEWFTNTEDNFFHTRYTPNGNECWYRFTAEKSTATVTLLGKHPETRFKIVQADSLAIEYDSNDPINYGAHKSKFCGAFSCGEKDKVNNLNVGQEYFLIIYTPEKFTPLNFVEDTINVSVGMPHMAMGMTEWIHASKQITVSPSAYTDIVIPVGDFGDTIPHNAYATRIDFSSDGRYSDIEYWRFMTPSGTYWNKLGKFGISMAIDYQKDADASKNTRVEGDWKIGCKASLSTKTIVPRIYINYMYELGD